MYVQDLIFYSSAIFFGRDLAQVLLSGFFDISDALFPPQFCSKFDMVKSIWVNFVLADEACE